MNKVNESRLHSFEEDFGTSSVCRKAASDPELNINQRMAQLLFLLQQIDESAGVEEFPEGELSQMVTYALGMCGFVDPNERRDVIASVLAAIEKGDPISGDPFPGQPISGDQALSWTQVRRN